MRLKRSARERPAAFDAAALAGASMALLLGIVGAGLRAVGDAPFARPIALEPRTLVVDGPTPTRPSQSVAARSALADESTVLGRRLESASSPTARVNLPRAPSSSPSNGSQWHPNPRPDIHPVENPPQDNGTQPDPVPQPPTPTPSPEPPTPVPSSSPTVEPSPSQPPDTPGRPEEAEQHGSGPPDHAKKEKEKSAKGKSDTANAAPDVVPITA